MGYTSFFFFRQRHDHGLKPLGGQSVIPDDRHQVCIAHDVPSVVSLVPVDGVMGPDLVIERVRV